MGPDSLTYVVLWIADPDQAGLFIRLVSSKCTVLTLLKKNYEIPGFFYQTFQGLGLGKLFTARESLVSDIPAEDGKSLNLYLQCMTSNPVMYI